MDELSKDELAAKCKHYLTLAQKAKQAKDETLKKVEELETKLQLLEGLQKEKTVDNETISKEANVSILEAQLESFERRTSRLSDENDKLLVALDTSEQKCKRLEEELKNCCKETEVTELRSQNNKLQEKLEEVNKTRKAVVEKLEEVSIETRQLIKNSEQISDENELLKKQVTTLQDCKKNNEFEIEKLQEKFAKVTVANELMKEENAKLEEANDVLKKQLLEKSKEIELLASKSLEYTQNTEYISALTSKIEALEKGNIFLQQELDNSNEKSLLEENEVLKEKLLSASENILSSKKMVVKLKETVINELSALLSENEARVKDLLDAKAYLCNIKDITVTTLKHKVSKLRMKNMELVHDNAQLKAILSEKTALDEERLVEKNEVSKTLENIKEEVSKLKCDKDRLELENSELNEATKNLARSDKKFKESIEESTKLRQEKLQLTSDNEELKNKLDSLHFDFVKIQEKCNELDRKASNINKENLELLQKKFDALLEENSVLKEDVKKWKLEESNLVAKNTELTAKSEDLKNEKHQFEKVEKDLLVSIQNLTSENEELKTKRSNLEFEKSKSEKDVVDLEKKLKDLIFEKESLMSDKEKLCTDVKNLKTLVEKLQNDIKTFNEGFEEEEQNHHQSIQQLENHIKCLEEEKSQIISLEAANQSLKEQIKSLETEILKLRESVVENENIKMKLNDCISMINQLEEKNSEMESLAKRAETLELSKSKAEAEIRLQKESAAVIFQKVEEFQHLRRDLKDFMHSSFQDLSQFSSFINQDILEKVNVLVESKNAAMKRNHADLLSEMQEMVTILKQRGEFISKLEQKLSEKNEETTEITSSFIGKINQLKKEIAVLNATVDSEKSSKSILEESLAKTEKQLIELRQELLSKNLVVDQLKSEMLKLENSLKEKDEVIASNEQDLSRLRDLQENDTLSTSTISRTEEANRLKDVEESFEDRYSKLKVVAVKLKKKCNDLARQLETEKKKFVEEQSELQQKVQMLTAKLKNTQCLQQELDKACDNLELYQNDLKSLQKKLDEEKHEKIKLLEELKVVRSQLKEKIDEIESLQKEKGVLKSSVDSLSSLMETLQKEKKAAELVCQQKEKELNKMREKLVEKEKEMISTNQQLEEAHGASKKQNILNLELQDYEKTVSDLTQQLNVEKSRVKSLQDELQEAQKARTTLNDQVSALETQISVERSKAIKLTENLSSTESKLSEVENSVKKYKDEISMLSLSLEKEKSHCEDVSLQLAEVSSQCTKFKESSEVQHKSLVDQINSLTAQLDRLNKALHESQEECETIKSDFQSYKIRVHSVLEKHKKENMNQKEEELVKIRLEQLEASNRSLKLQLDNISVELETAKFELNKALSEKDSSEKSLKEIRVTLTKKHKELDECKNELKAFKVKTDLLVSCHKAQMEEIRNKYETELQALQEKISFIQNEVSKNEQGAMKESSDSLCKQSNPDFEFSATREEGEGSENTDISPASLSIRTHSQKQTIVPLDQLLEATDLNIEDEVVQIDELKHDLATYQSQVQHLSALLNESEKNNARNEQLNSFLKEEIRRLERSLERQPHITNSEYLKNIIFKFITLQSGDERSRLVPVLDTILKLSPEESKKVLAVASGNAEMPSGWNFLSW